MAPELLDENSDRMPSADIFSFGISLYEVCMIGYGLQSLPSEGPMWRALRDGKFDRVPDRHPTITNLVQQALSPNPGERPTSADILLMHGVVANGHDIPDIVLINSRTRMLLPPPLARSASFAPSSSRVSHSFDPDLHASLLSDPHVSLSTTGEMDTSGAESSVHGRIMTPTAEYGTFHGHLF